jgi:hypothetical protein
MLFDAEDLAASVDDRLLDVQGKHARLVDALAVD